MQLAIFDDHRLGVVVDGGLVDVTAALPWEHETDPLTAGWWRRLCRDFPTVRDRLGKTAREGPVLPLDRVRLGPPALGPSKIIAAASNYAEHVAEMHGVQERTLGGVEAWMMTFDVFLKAPSSIVGPGADIVLPADVLDAGHEVHHESELVIVIGAGGKDISSEHALDHVFGYTVGLDITVRSAADRSRRKSYDTFSPVGPWVTTGDGVDPTDLTIDLTVNGVRRQHVNTRDMLMGVARIIAYASSVMTLLPGDLIFTGAPPGVGPITVGDDLRTTISGLGELRTRVRRAN
ncbi:fumarylacetoacetate hydrolase family protein [Micromonospora sp. NPDC004704]